MKSPNPFPFIQFLSTLALAALALNAVHGRTVPTYKHAVEWHHHPTFAFEDAADADNEGVRLRRAAFRPEGDDIDAELAFGQLGAHREGVRRHLLNRRDADEESVMPAVFVGEDGVARLLRDADGAVVAVPVAEQDVAVTREKRSAGGFHHPVHIFKKRNNFTYTAHHFYKVPYGHHGRK